MRVRMGKPMHARILRHWSFAAICRSGGIRILVEMVIVFVVLQTGLVIYSNRTIGIGTRSDLLSGALTYGDLQRGRYDNYRTHVIQDSVFVGSAYPSPRSMMQEEEESGHEKPIVCLATQTSIDRLHHLIEMGQHWRGFMSVAVYTPRYLEHQVAVAYLEYLSKCHWELMQNVSVHFVFPVVQSHPREQQLADESPIWAAEGELLECDEWRKRLEQESTDIVSPTSIMSQNLSDKEVLYPQNLMRNVARKNCVAEYVLLTDVDIIPVMNLATKLQAFFQLEIAKGYKSFRRVFVLPTYEMTANESQPLPINKSELLDLARHKKARSYRSKAFRPNQGATNIGKWEMITDTGTTRAGNKSRSGSAVDDHVPSIAYQVSTFHFYYEPFYVARDDVPQHDERFVGYGFTRNTQVWELAMAGYKLFVLDNVFLVHRGMSINAYSFSKRRKKQVQRGWTKVLKFMKEVTVRYNS